MSTSLMTTSVIPPRLINYFRDLFTFGTLWTDVFDSSIVSELVTFSSHRGIHLKPAINIHLTLFGT